MWYPENDDDLQKAVSDYLFINGLALPENFVYEPVIDGVYVCVSNNVVLRVGLPPVSNYNIRETEHTDKYLRAGKLVKAS